MLAKLRKLQRADSAVSPVIAVILMVAITVVLAATVYVWVSGFGASSGTPAKTISLTSAAPFSTDKKDYVVASATSGMKYSDIAVTLNGAAVDCVNGSPAAGTAADPKWAVSRDGGATFATVACSGASAGVVTAGDLIRIDSDADFTGQTLRILDSQANSVILTLVVG